MPSCYYREKLRFTSNTMKKLFFVHTHDSISSSSSSSSSSNTIVVTRVYYSPYSGRANQNVNCHNLRASTPFFCPIFGCSHRWRPISCQIKSSSCLAEQFKTLDPITLPAVSTPVSVQSTAPRNLFPRRVIKTHSVKSLGDIS